MMLSIPFLKLNNYILMPKVHIGYVEYPALEHHSYLLIFYYKNDFSDDEKDDRERCENQHEGVDFRCPTHPQNNCVSDRHDREREP